MRKRYYPILILCLFLASCQSTPHEAQPMIHKAEMLLDTFPDNNLLPMDSIMKIGVELGEEVDLEQAYDYFAKRKQYDKAAYAALFNGFTALEEDKARAMSSLKDAERYALLAHDTLAVAHAQYQMGDLLFHDGMEKESIDVLNAANQHFGNHYQYKALAMNAMSCSYLLMNQFESADSCLQLALSYNTMMPCIETEIKVMNNYAVLYRLQGNYGRAIQTLKQTEHLADSVQSVILNLNLCKTYHTAGFHDSATYYYQKLHEELPYVKLKDETLASVYNTLSVIAEQQGDLVQALYYIKKHEKLAYQIQLHREEKNIYHIQRQYDYAKLQNAMNLRMIHKQRVIVVLSVVIMLAVIALAITQIYITRIRKQETDIKASLIQFMHQNQKLTQENETISQDMSQQIEAFHSIIKSQNEKIAKSQVKELQIKQKLAIYLEHDDDISLLQSLKFAVWGGDSFWEAMENSFDQRYPGMREKIIEQCPDLNDKEIKILLLTLLDASRHDTALLLHTSVHMVDKLRNIARKKFDNINTIV